jgi:peptidoglycan/xylan/chitin deacetylase (PgdA/CDA1 family)
MRWVVALFVCVAAGVSVPALAQTCPGNPDALGTSRVLTINDGEFVRLGTLQYKQTLPLKDHEVVLTFDDGPLPPYTDTILDTLASQCVKATYFLVGQMAHAYPSTVRRIYNEGHTIGSHSQDHPRAFERLSMQRVEREVDGGINSVKAALGDAKALSPFFRLPGLGRTNAIERFLEKKQLVTWSIDVDTNDWWRGSTPAAIVKRTMRRLNAKGRGIILMHDIHRATAIALPMLLKELKADGYEVVHVVAAGERPKSAPELIALPATDGKVPPTVLASAPNEPRQKHRMRKHSASRHHPLRSYDPGSLSKDRMSALGG